MSDKNFTCQDEACHASVSRLAMRDADGLLVCIACILREPELAPRVRERYQRQQKRAALARRNFQRGGAA